MSNDSGSNYESFYKEEFKKPLEEIKEDIFFRADNFKNEEWYGDFLIYTQIGVCQPSPEHALEIQKALKIMGYPTHTSEHKGKICITPGVQREPEQRQEEIKMSYYNNKPSREPHSTEKLTEELSKCVELQETMKEVNAYWRKAGTCVGAPGITEEQAKKLDEKIATTHYSYEKQPFSSYDLTNNNSKIKRLERKVKEISKGFNGWEFEGGRAEANTELNRLQLFFDKKTDKETHNALRHAGFVFSHANEAYQRQLNDNAINAAGRLDFLKPTDGRTVRDHQPKAPVKDSGAR